METVLNLHRTIVQSIKLLPFRNWYLTLKWTHLIRPGLFLRIEFYSELFSGSTGWNKAENQFSSSWCEKLLSGFQRTISASVELWFVSFLTRENSRFHSKSLVVFYFFLFNWLELIFFGFFCFNIFFFRLLFFCNGFFWFLSRISFRSACWSWKIKKIRFSRQNR